METKTIRDEESGKDLTFKVISEHHIILVNPQTNEDIVEIKINGDDVIETDLRPSMEAFTNRFTIKETDNDAIGRCAKGCALSGRGAECYLKCRVTNGGTDWIQW